MGARLSVKFRMRAERNEVCRIGINLFVNCAQISSDIYTSPSLPNAVERVVLKKRMKRIFIKQVDTFLCTAFFSLLKPLVMPSEFLVENRSHDFPSRYAIASSALSNIGEMFLFFL